MWRTNLGLVIAAVMVFLALPSLGQAGDPNLVAYWAFDEGAGTIAYDSAGDNDGTINDANWAEGKIGGALSFDGSGDYVDCGTGPAITGTGPFSVSAWFKTGIVDNRTIVVQRSATSTAGFYGLHTRADGRAQLQIYNGGYGCVVQSDVTVCDGLWHHVVAVRTNSTDGEIYVDGSLSGTDSGPAKSLSNFPVWIGGRDFTPAYTWTGEIDEVMIFDRALSAEEVEHLYWEGFSDLELAIMRIEEAIAEKEEALVGIDAALEAEWGAYAELEELLASGDYGDLNKRDISAAQRKIESSIRREERSLRVVLDSIDELEDALLSLGWEPEPEPNVPEPNVPEPNVPVQGKVLKGSRLQR